MSNEIKLGDTVRLKSGGPAMSVTQVGKDGGEPTVWCSWFDGETEQKSFFPIVAVEPV